MAILTFGGDSYTVDHAVKGANYIHGYDANGLCIVAFEDVTDLAAIEYDGVFMSPGDCAEEVCNKVVYCSGKFKTLGGDNIAIAETYTATVATDWSGTAAPYSKAVTINGLLASDAPIIDLVASSTFATAETQIEAWGYVYRAVTADNTLTLYATEKPTVALPIQLKVVRK